MPQFCNNVSCRIFTCFDRNCSHSCLFCSVEASMLYLGCNRSRCSAFSKKCFMGRVQIEVGTHRRCIHKILSPVESRPLLFSKGRASDTVCPASFSSYVDEPHREIEQPASIVTGRTVSPLHDSLVQRENPPAVPVVIKGRLCQPKGRSGGGRCRKQKTARSFNPFCWLPLQCHRLCQWLFTAPIYCTCIGICNRNSCFRPLNYHHRRQTCS